MQLGWQDLRGYGFPDNRVVDREQYLNPAVQVPWHKISAAEKNLLISAIVEIVDPCVLEEPAHNRAYGNIVADPGYAGAQAADPANLQFYPDPGLRCPVQGTDTEWINQGIHLEDEMTIPLPGLVLDLTINTIDNPVPQ